MPEKRYAVAVVGLGIMGSCTLWRLAARGVPAIGFDRYDPPHTMGSSHGLSRIVRRVQFEGDAYVPLARQAFALWAALQRDSGRQLFTRTGLLFVGPQQSQMIRGGRQSAERGGVEHQMLDAAALRSRHPQHRVADTEIALYDPDAGYIDPEAATAAALERAQALGAEVRRNCQVIGLRAAARGIDLETTAGRIRAGHVVVAAGTWLGSLVPGLDRQIAIERHCFALLPVADPELFSPARFPMWIRENGAGLATSIEDTHDHKQRIFAFGFPCHDGRHIKVGFPVTGSPAVSPAVEREPLPVERAMFDERRVSEVLDGVEAGSTRFTVCLYDNSPDFDFIIGALPGTPRVTMLGGFSGHGFKHAPAVGEIAACLATGAAPPIDITAFSPARFA
jgi:sarcosine oxidase